MKHTVYVLGQDIASISSGLNLVKGVFRGSYIEVSSIAEKAYKINNNFLSRYENARNMYKDAQAIDSRYGLDLVVNEDYINSSFSHVAFSLAEFNGIVRAFYYNNGYSILFNIPGKLRSFIADGRKLLKGNKAKNQIMDWCKSDFNYVSTQVYAKERSDCSDAFVHGVIGVYYCFLISGLPLLSSLSQERQKIFSSPKASGLCDNKSLLLNPERLYNRLEVKL